jgi:trigger factor
MKVEVFTESTVLKRLEVEVEREAVDTELSRAYKNLATRVRLKGFRPGKVPLEIVKKQYGNQVHNEVTEKLLRASFGQAIQEKALQYVGNPRFEEVELKPGESLKYKVKVEVKPEITIKTLKVGDITKDKPKLSEKALEKELLDLRRKNGQIKSRPEEEVSVEGDILTIDFLGVGSKTFIPGFEEQLIGVKRGDHEVKATFPEDYARKDLAGKEALFAVTIKDIRQRIIPELDDEFAKDVGEFESLAQLKEKLSDEILMKARDRAEMKLKENLLKAAIEKNPFEVPPSLIERQIDYTIQDTTNRLKQQGIDFTKFDMDMQKLRDDLRVRATFQVAASLLIEAVARQKTIGISDTDITGHFEKLATASNEPVAKIAAYFRQPQRLEPLKFQLLEEKVLDLLNSEATITEVESDAEDVASEENE